MAVIGLLPEYAEVSGSIRLHGDELLGLVDRRMSQIRGKTIGTVFQDPMSALTPVYTVGDQIAEALQIHNRDISKAMPPVPARRTARSGRHRPARAARPLLPPRAVRRRTATRRDRDRDRQRPRPDDLRRADDRAGRHRAGADPRGAQDRARRHRRGRADHHPRPRGGRRVRRPRAGDVRGQGRRDGAGRGSLPRSPDALHRRASRFGATARRPARSAAGADPRRTAVDGQASARVPVHTALPAGHRRLPRRRARTPRGRSTTTALRASAPNTSLAAVRPRSTASPPNRPPGTPPTLPWCWPCETWSRRTS